jgi:hypothetical protein
MKLFDFNFIYQLYLCTHSGQVQKKKKKERKKKENATDILKNKHNSFYW